MDTVCLYNTLYAAGSDAALQAVDPQGDRISTYEDVYQHGMRDVYVKFKPGLAIVSTASPANYHATFSSIPAGRYGRVFILTEPHSVPTVIDTYANYTQEDSGDPEQMSRRLCGLLARAEQSDREDPGRDRKHLSSDDLPAGGHGL